MKVLITGCDGFLGKELTRYFSKNHTVIATNRKTLNPANLSNVSSFFKKNKVDIVVHTAVKGGKRNHEDCIEDLYKNITMFDNLASCSEHYKALFNFGSGAEFNRTKSIHLVAETDIYGSFPEDYYGLSKNLITRKINDLNSNIFNLRLYGCFGFYEEEQRLFRSMFNKVLNSQPFEIHQDKYMDYFYAQDVGKVIEHLANNLDKRLKKDYNLCYDKKYKLSELAIKIKNLTNHQQNVIINNKEMGLSYTGANNRLKDLNIDLLGLEIGMQNCFTEWRINGK